MEANTITVKAGLRYFFTVSRAWKQSCEVVRNLLAQPDREGRYWDHPAEGPG